MRILKTLLMGKFEVKIEIVQVVRIDGGFWKAKI